MLKLILVFLFVSLLLLWGASFFIARDIVKEFPPIGDFREVFPGTKMHFVDSGPVPDVSLPAIVFLHGASGNLRDPLHVYRPRLEGSLRTLFVDRPGHGYSDSFAGSNDPKEQAKALAVLLDELEIQKAVIVGHSFGGVVTGAFGVLYPQKTAGLVFLAPVSHPWRTGVDWHYDVGNTPLIGTLFSYLIVPVAGSFIYPKAIKNVFTPNAMPVDYKETSATRLVLRPDNFLQNARDVARVSAHVEEFHPRYKEISAPVVIFHGDTDDIVSLEIHSVNGLSKDIKGAKLVVLEGVGHKPDYVAAEEIEAEIRKMADL